jgi:hypothetical protein
MIISNSEVETYNNCERQHYYKFGLGLRPLVDKAAIRLGVYGHYVLESYYRQGLETNNRRVWYDAAIASIQELIDGAKSEQDHDLISLVTTRFHQYINYYADDTSWRIVDVEGTYILEIAPEISYAMTLDLLIQETVGPARGQYVVIDHKFIYRFHSIDEILMNAQIPKYIYTLRQSGFDVRYGMLNEIRSRTGIQDETKLFNRAVIRPSAVRMRGLIREQERTSDLIKRRLERPIANYRETARRNVAKITCGNCDFRLPCSMALDERFDQESRILAISYVPNTYGYRHDNDASPDEMSDV